MHNFLVSFDWLIMMEYPRKVGKQKSTTSSVIYGYDDRDIFSSHHKLIIISSSKNDAIASMWKNDSTLGAT